MSMGKRHIGRRVAGVGVAVTLMMLGLAAPAFAAAPTVASFTPTSGPENCVVVITGTAFTDIPSADASWDVEFDLDAIPGGGINATTFAIISATEIWATVPNLTPGSAYVVRVANSQGTGNSTATFLATADNAGGACAPTITSFTPTCGSAGTAVVITGTNLLEPDLTGGDVRFAPYPGTEAVTVQPDVDTATSLSVVVPSGVADGAIRVNTITNPAAGQAFSATPFLTPPPDCVPVTGDEHARSISFKISKAGKTSGVVSSTEDPAFTDCVAAVPVKIQRKKSGAWKTVGTTTTNDSGAYTKKVKNPKGTQKFRALAPKVSLGDPVTDVCLKARSAVRKK
jgi:IPT/TIG domain